MKMICSHASVLICAFFALASTAHAEVVRFQIEKSQAYAASPEQFQLLEGHFEGAVDPTNSANAIITDAKLAPRDAQGRVGYRATFKILVPRNPLGVLIYDVPNRGNGDVTAFPDGHVSIISGWQGDLPLVGNLQRIEVPTARNADGSPIHGTVLARFLNMPPGAPSLDIVDGAIGSMGGRSFAPATDKGARLYRSKGDTTASEEVPRSNWRLADCANSAFPGTPNLGKVCVKGGFDPSYSYTLSYQTKDPKVLGLGYAATRDLVSFLRHAERDATGTPNPLAGKVRWAIGRGYSQSGNYLRSFLHLGFNADESGRIVFDGLMPIIAARQTALNFRFATPGGAAELYEAGSDGILWWGKYRDKVRGLPAASLLDRCTASKTCPRIVEHMGAAEFWGLRASPGYVGTDAKADIALPPNVRRYYNPGVTHGGGRGGFSTKAAPWPGCALLSNPNPTSHTDRALFAALVAWVSQGTEPPPSKYPTMKNGDLVQPTAKAMGFPTIPGHPLPDGHLNAFLQYDFGKSFNVRDLTGEIGRNPPKIVRTLPSLVPRVDTDGNELAGVKSVLLQAPLGTYTGWNVVTEGVRTGQNCVFWGGYIPFAKTRAERMTANDPRPSLEERYGSHGAYVEKVKQAAAGLVAERFLLPDDAKSLITEAENSGVLLP